MGLGKRTATESSSPAHSLETLVSFSPFLSFAKNCTVAPGESAEFPRWFCRSKFLRRPVAQRGVQSLSVVIPLDELLDIRSQVFQVGVSVRVDLFLLQRLHETLAAGIIVRVGWTAHARNDSVLLQDGHVFSADVRSILGEVPRWVPNHKKATKDHEKPDSRNRIRILANFYFSLCRSEVLFEVNEHSAVRVSPFTVSLKETAPIKTSVY